jgi:hypothetical protein
MNILRRVYERVVDIVTGTDLIEVHLSPEGREVLEAISKLSGLKPSTVMRVISAEALIRSEGFATIQQVLSELASPGAT